MDFSTPISTVIPSLDSPVLPGARARRPDVVRPPGARPGRHVQRGGSPTGPPTTGFHRLGPRRRGRQFTPLPLEPLPPHRPSRRTPGQPARHPRGQHLRLAHPALHASLYGAAARGAGDHKSEVTLLLIRSDQVATDNLLWEEQVGGLMSAIVELTGNPVDVDELSLRDLANHHHAAVPVVEAWLHHPTILYGPTVQVLLSGRASIERPILADLPSLPDLANFPTVPALTAH